MRSGINIKKVTDLYFDFRLSELRLQCGLIYQGFLYCTVYSVLLFSSNSLNSQLPWNVF